MSAQVASSAQQRNLQSTAVASSAYPVSPQLTIASDISSQGLHAQYPQSYSYAPHQTEAPSYGFPPHQAAYRIQTQLPPVQSNLHSHSPNDPRKRRTSELELTESATSSHSAFGTGPPVKNEYGEALVPAQKKGRTNTPWTPEEEMRLKSLRDSGSSWNNIAKEFPKRTEGSVKKHWYKDMHYAEFTQEEVSSTAFSTALHNAIKEYENNKWKEIGKKLGKPAKACESYARQNGWIKP